MRKLLLFAILFFVFTGMKVVYKNDTGEVTAIGPFVNYVPQDGHSVIEDPDALPEQIQTHKVGTNGRYRVKNNQERQADTDREETRRQANNTDRQSALTKLRALGLTNQEMKTIGLMRENE